MDSRLDAAKALLCNTKAEQLFPSERRSIVVVQTKDKITQAFKVLIDNRILSAPVFDVSKQKFIGFIDMVDIVEHALRVLSESEFMGGELPQLLEAKERFASFTCSMLMDISKRNPYLPVESSAPILKAIQLMVKWKVHRIPIVSTDGELITIISQTGITEFIHNNLDQFDDLPTKTVQSLQLGFVEVVTVNQNLQAVEAFRKMRQHNISAVGVVDDEGALIGNISVTDLKVLAPDVNHLSRLFLPISDFLRVISPNEVIQGPICVTPTATFEEVLTKLVLTKVHRVYIVEEGKPIGVISQHEILKTITSLLAL